MATISFFSSREAHQDHRLSSLITASTIKGELPPLVCDENTNPFLVTDKLFSRGQSEDPVRVNNPKVSQTQHF